MDEADAIIATLGLSPHPEGGWYAETWRAPAAGGTRPAGTAIYFLLKPGERSRWHRVDAAEVWLWHAGAPVMLSVAAGPEGPARRVRLGPALDRGERPQAVVPEGHWQAAAPLTGWALVSCVVAPGFRFEGFELAPDGFPVPFPPVIGEDVLAQHFPEEAHRWFDAMEIGATPESRDAGARLILDGVKTATSAGPWEAPAFPGALSVLLDGSGTPRAIVETTSIERRPFGEIGAAFAHAYGEGDRTLDWFRREMGRHYAEEAKARGTTFDADTPLWCERFGIVKRLG